MSEEEKKAFNLLDLGFDNDIDNNSWEIIKNLIEKLQREIEESKYLENNTYQNYAILKQKIKDRIKFINNLEENLYYKENVIFILQELLEEKEI